MKYLDVTLKYLVFILLEPFLQIINVDRFNNKINNINNYFHITIISSKTFIMVHGPCLLYLIHEVK